MSEPSSHERQVSLQEALRNLDHWHSQRRAAAVDQLVALGEPAVEPLIAILRNPRAGSEPVAGAVHALGRIGLPAVPSLLESLRDRQAIIAQRAAHALQESRTPPALAGLRQYVIDSFPALPARRRRRRIILSYRCLGIGLFGIYLRAVLGPHFAADIVAGYFLFSFCTSGIVNRWDRDLGSKFTIRRLAVSAIAETRDRRDVDLLARCLQDENPDIRQEAAKALTSMLAGLRASDAGALSTDAMAALIRELGRRNADLIRAILTALEQVGDERAVPAVERLATGHGAGRRSEVRNAAVACLPALRERAEQSVRAHTLLRPASPTEEAAAALLRPAGAGETPVENLLRARKEDG